MQTVRTTTARLLIESDMQVAESIPVSCGNVAALCRRRPDSIEPNEDSAAVIETANDALLLVVADGMGGGPMGHKASSIAIESVRDHICNWESTDLRVPILDGIEAANREILDLGIGAATTLAVVEINQNRARGYQVGDSQALIVGQRGLIKWMSTPQSPVGYAVESGLLDEVEALHHEDRHLVSNMVGTREMHIDIGPTIELSPRDTVMVGSDGLFDNATIDEVIEIGRTGHPVDRVNALAQLSGDRMTQQENVYFENAAIGKPDDLTILLFTPGG